MKIAVVYYSMTGGTYHLARLIEEGAVAAGAEVRLRKVPELIDLQTIESNPAMKAAHLLQQDVPLATHDDLVWADGIAFGSPTRYGNVSAQLKNFLDQTGSLWAAGKLVGKAAGFFSGAQTMHGGHETTILTMSTFAYHHGMIIVPASYAIAEVGSTASGGSPYGPSHLGSLGPEPSAEEQTIARAFGSRLAEVAAKLSQ